jgi:hypothetical protein
MANAVDNSKKCGIDRCDGGKDCWQNVQPIYATCKQCDCLTCTKGTCTPSDEWRMNKW